VNKVSDVNNVNKGNQLKVDQLNQLNNKKTKALLLVGVGGQGTILASKILSEGLVKLGYDVKMSEIHGMAQRGGSVTTQIKYGEKIYSPIIGTGEADVIVAFEKAEAVRYLSYLKEDGTLVVNEHEIYPLPVLLGQEEYPSNSIEYLRERVSKLKVLDANTLAAELGNAKAQNIVLLGTVIKALGLEELDWVEVLKAYLPPKLHELNIKAFDAGLRF
jgi:indolepyruvate ferredoxin oxidoreductase beta subunit